MEVNHKAVPKLKVLIEDARYFEEQESFVLIIKDVETGKVCDRPLQVTKATMMQVAGVDPDNPNLDKDTLHWYASLLRQRREPIMLESPEEDEMTPFLESALNEMKRADDYKYGKGSFEEWKRDNQSGLFIPG